MNICISILQQRLQYSPENIGYMTNLETSYLGLKLKNPIIVGSCGLTGNLESIKRIVVHEPGAIVLKSLFEEQINADINKNILQNTELSAEAETYISSHIAHKNISDYLTLIKECKKITDIPIIASIHCTDVDEWISYAKKIESAGADALEVNASILPFDEKLQSTEIEEQYFHLLEQLREHVSLPIALKMSYYSSSLTHFLQKLSWTGHVQGFVLFNRFYNPDINIQTQEIGVSNIFSSAQEYTLPLRWVAICSAKIETDVCASTGIHNADTIIKMILAGANATQIVSCVYQQGPEIISNIKKSMIAWMKTHQYKSINDFYGKLSASKETHILFERNQFMKYYGSVE